MRGADIIYFVIASGGQLKMKYNNRFAVIISFPSYNGNLLDIAVFFCLKAIFFIFCFCQML